MSKTKIEAPAILKQWLPHTASLGAGALFAAPVALALLFFHDQSRFMQNITPMWLLPGYGFHILWLVLALGLGVSAALLWHKRKAAAPSLAVLLPACALLSLTWSFATFRLTLPALPFLLALCWLVVTAISMRAISRTHPALALPLTPMLTASIYLTFLSYYLEMVNP